MKLATSGLSFPAIRWVTATLTGCHRFSIQNHTSPLLATARAARHHGPSSGYGSGLRPSDTRTRFVAGAILCDCSDQIRRTIKRQLKLVVQEELAEESTMTFQRTLVFAVASTLVKDMDCFYQFLSLWLLGNFPLGLDDKDRFLVLCAEE